MSKKYETRKVTVDRETLVEIRCDLCGRIAPQSFTDWGKDSYDVAETEVMMKTGTSYPEGGHITETAFDICPDCFRSRLIPWMKSQDATPHSTETDF